MILSILIIAVLIFTLFRLFNFIAERLKNKFELKAYLKVIIPLTELFAWVLFILWVAKIIYVSRNYYVLFSISIISFLLAVPLFLLIRDFLSGIFLKLQNEIAEGMRIDIGEISGVVKKAGHFRFSVEDRHGNINSVSYYKIRSKIISHIGNNQHLKKVTIEFVLEKTSNSNQQITQLKNDVMNTPWVSVAQPPIIENTRIENEKLIVDVGVFVLDNTYTEYIKNAVLKYISSS